MVTDEEFDKQCAVTVNDISHGISAVLEKILKDQSPAVVGYAIGRIAPRMLATSILIMRQLSANKNELKKLEDMLIKAFNSNLRAELKHGENLKFVKCNTENLH